MGLFGGLSGGGGNPADAAMPYLNQIPGIGHQYYDPYVQGGQEAGGILKGEYGKMLNPTDFMGNIMKSYSESPWAQYQADQLGKGINATAAAGGVSGTPFHQKQMAEMQQGIMSKDMQQYLQNALGIYGSGIQGEQDFYNKGYGASGALADYLGGNLGAQAGLAYKGAQQEGQDQANFFDALGKALGAGAGFAMGGPAGAMTGAKLFG